MESRDSNEMGTNIPPKRRIEAISLTALSCTLAMGHRISAVPFTITLTLVAVAPNSGLPFQWSSGMNGVWRGERAGDAPVSSLLRPRLRAPGPGPRVSSRKRTGVERNGAEDDLGTRNNSTVTDIHSG